MNLYGIRPHIEWTPEEHEQALAFVKLPPRSVTIDFSITDENRWTVELLFHMCLKCHQDLSECSCHERGYD